VPKIKSLAQPEVQNEYLPGGRHKLGVDLPTKLVFKRLPVVPEPDELLIMAFRHASKAASGIKLSGKPLEVAKHRESKRIEVMSKTVRTALTNIVAGTPSLSNLPPFYRELVGTIVDVDTMRKSLGAIDGTAKVVGNLERDHLRRLRFAKSPAETSAVRRQAYGRISSVVRRSGVHLTFLREAAGKLTSIPSVYVDMPTIVIAGYPNVGKTTLLTQLTTSEPEIAPYPFTTRGLKLGFFEENHVRYQVIDTPGLFDRPFEKRNPIERQAIAALSNLADAVVFILDPSETCGYELQGQIRLLEDIRKTFADIDVLVVANKADLLDESRMNVVRESGIDVIFISAATGQGVPELKKLVIKILG
jgi:nucleolar GTP-binding protein